MNGANVDPRNPNDGAPSAERLLERGIRWVRLVSRSGFEDYLEALRSRGIMVLAVVTEESRGYLCPADVYQVGNEPEIPGRADSFSPADYREYFRLYRETYPDPPMIAAGLASGGVAWWSEVQALGGLEGASGYGVHPYGKTAAQASTLLRAYAKCSKLPIWVTEWNWPTAEIPAFVAMLRQNAALWAWFCWHDYAGWRLDDVAARVLGAC